MGIRKVLLYFFNLLFHPLKHNNSKIYVNHDVNRGAYYYY